MGCERGAEAAGCADEEDIRHFYRLMGGCMVDVVS